MIKNNTQPVSAASFNKNIKSIILFSILILASSKSFTQNAYLKFQSGYQISSNPSSGQNTVSNTSSTFTTTTTTSKNIGLGTGLNFGAAIGYDFSENIGAEIGVNYLFGHKYELTDESTNLNMNNTYDNLTSTIYSRMLFINPSFILKASAPKLNPYMRLGIVMGIGSVRSENTTESSMNNISSKEYTKFITNGGLAWGANGAIGVVHELNQQISIYAEASIQSINYKPKKSEMVEAELNGNDILNTYSNREKISEFSDKYTRVDSGNTPNPNQAKESARINLPLSNLLLQIGVKISLNK